MSEVVPLYRRHARRFDAARSRSLMERPYLEAAAALAPPPGRVLDLGCGTGEPLARWFIERGYAVTGLDAAPEMLALCRERFPAQTWVAGDLRTFDLGARFDVLLAWDSSFHLPVAAQRALVPSLARHAAPGAALVFTSGEHEGEAIGDLFGDPLYHASLATAEYAALLRAHGFAPVLHRTGDPECGGHTVWVARFAPGPAPAGAG